MTDGMSAMADFSGKRVTVMGLGVFGGGVGVTKFLAKEGARVLVTDLRPAEDLSASVEELAGLDIAYRLGEHVASDFVDADLVVVNPAVPPHAAFLKIAMAHGTPLDTEMNIFFRRCPARIAAVTGSNGKSTTTALLAAMLEKSGRRVWLGGNIGACLLGRLHEMRPDDAVVLELSSFQLQRLRWIERSPHLSLVLNLAPNHLDWHGTMDAYRDAKRNILRYQAPNDRAILCEDDPEVAGWRDLARGRAIGFSVEHELAEGAFATDGEIVLRLDGEEQRISLSDFSLPGPHNRSNAAGAAMAARLFGATADGIALALAGFESLPHRLQLVNVVEGVRYYDDSVATTPESSIVALRSFKRPIIILGGYDKKLPFDGLGRETAQRAKAAILIGAAADRIQEAIEAGEGDATIVREKDLADAVRRAAKLASSGDAVLLSTACASYDMFRNYEHRAAVFCRLVAGLKSH